MKTLTNVFPGMEVPPEVPGKKSACLATYLIATGHHLCLRFPLLVFWAETRLISRLSLIRGRISEHSWVSQTTHWQNMKCHQSIWLLVYCYEQWKQTKCRLSRWCRKQAGSVHRKSTEASEASQKCHCGKSLRSAGVRNILFAAWKEV